jgi:hypothetical protein
MRHSGIYHTPPVVARGNCGPFLLFSTLLRSFPFEPKLTMNHLQAMRVFLKVAENVRSDVPQRVWIYPMQS